MIGDCHIELSSLSAPPFWGVEGGTVLAGVNIVGASYLMIRPLMSLHSFHPPVLETGTTSSWMIEPRERMWGDDAKFSLGRGNME